MQWDNSPVYRRRRRIVAGATVLLLAAVTSCTVQLGKVLRDDSPATTQQAPAPSADAARSPQPRTGSAQDVTIAFGGDVNAHGEAARITRSGLGQVGEVLAAADLAMVNLETVVAQDRSGLRPEPKPFTFATGPALLDTLKAAGIDVVTAANNHSMDFGEEGMRRMLQVKQEHDLPMVGIGHDQDEAWAPWVTTVKDRKVVIFGASDVLDAHLDWKATADKAGLAKVKDDDGLQRLLDGVRAARAGGPDVAIVVYLHSGRERVRCPTTRQQQTARKLAEAGADVVVGSHAHELQPTATVGNTLVAHGMGNFVFAAQSSTTRATGVLSVTIPGAPGPGRATFSPARIDQGVPSLLEGQERAQALQRWDALGKGCS